MFRKSPLEPLLSRGEVDGLIILLMSTDDGILRIARAARFARADAREAELRARLRRWTFGLYGREATQPTA